jgi:Skp family chaperone for outer membrane proteins
MATVGKLFFLVLALGLMAWPSAAHAQEVKIAVVDVEQILSESAAGQSIQQQLENRRQAFQKEFSSRENNLINSEKTLVQQKQSLSAEEFDTKRKEFETQLFETRNLFQKRRNALDKGLSAALSTLRESIIRITSDIATEEGYNVVLTRDSVVITAKEMDITQKVLSRMDKQMSTIPLNVAE